MPSPRIATAAVALVLAGCSQAEASEVDPQNDVHCAVLATGYRISGDIQNAPQDQKRALAVLDDWYGPKLMQASKERGEASVLAEAQPIADLMDRDLLSTKDEYMTCAERAFSDPAFGKAGR